MVATAAFLISGGVGAVYGWASSIYGYNRDAWMTDIQVHQEYEYQVDNLSITKYAMDREEIRDLMGADLQKLSNMILVATLILSLAGEMLFEAVVPASCPAFVLNAYMLCLVNAVFMLALAVTFGIGASSIAVRESTYMLTHVLRPAWEAVFADQGRRETSERTAAFEQQPLQKILAPPLATRVVGCRASRSKARLGTGQRFPPMRSTGRKGHSFLKRHASTEASEATHEISVWHDEWNAVRAKHWKSLSKGVYTCVVLGTKSLLDACSYFSLGRLYGDFAKDAWVLWLAQGIFAFLNVLIMEVLVAYSRSRNPFLERVKKLPINPTYIIAAGPIMLAISVSNADARVDRFCIPACYVSHVVASILSIALVQASNKKDSTCELHQYSVLSPGRPGVSKDCELAVLPDTIATHVTPPSQERGLDSDVDDGNADKVREPPEAPREVSGISFASETSHEHDPDGDRKDLFKAVKRYLRAPCLSLQIQERAIRRSPLPVMLCGTIFMCLIWVLNMVWAIRGAMIGMDFKNGETPVYITYTAPLPVVGEMPLNMTPPSPYFRPHALICPRDQVFMADHFRIYESSTRGTHNKYDTVKLYPCNANSTITDIVATCDDVGCWPIVLLSGAPPRILDCSSGKEERLLQATVPAIAFATRGSGRGASLYVALYDGSSETGRVVQYRRSGARDGWEPLWTVLEFRKDRVMALDVVGAGGAEDAESSDRLLVFHDEFTVESWSLGSGIRCRTWRLPDTMNGAGCAVKAGGGLHVIVMHKPQPSVGAVRRSNLFSAALPGGRSECEPAAADRPDAATV